MSGYLTRLLEAYQAGQIEPGTVTRVEVVHAAHCPADRGGACSCEPDMAIQTLATPDADKRDGASGRGGQ